MSRARILADTIARLEAERYAPLPQRPEPELADWTPQQQAEHRQILLDALSAAPVVVALREAS